MNPIYQFRLSVNGGAQQIARPLYADLAKEWNKESGYQFFRTTLSGKLTFISSDYELIHNAGMEERFDLEILISYTNGSTWSTYWEGYFYTADCEFSIDDKTAIVQPKPLDNYDGIMNALEKEVDLIPAHPQLFPLTYYKRPVVQIYIAGQAIIGCYLDGMYWEQSCIPVTDKTQLNNTYKMGLLHSLTQINATGSITTFFWGTTANEIAINNENNEYTYHREEVNSFWHHWLTRVGESQRLYETTTILKTGEIILKAVSGSGMTGTVTVNVSELNIFARLICDVTEYVGVQTEVLPDEDITETTYHYSVALNQASYGSIISISHLFDNEPTQWGIIRPNEYYVRPDDSYIPMARNSWGELSVWLNPYNLNVASPNMFERGAKEVVNSDTYKIENVLNVMFRELGLSLTFEAKPEYSQFFYGDTTTVGGNVIKNVDFRLYLTQKSNILVGQYDQAAQKALITLREIFEMFEKCFKCYWFIEGNKLRIEHIYWFINGGSYADSPLIGRDLTTERMMRNGKPLVYAQGIYSYDKPETIGQYQFGWMDDVTIPFKGEPIKIISPYVNQQSVENIDVSRFTSDVDYMQASPNECSKDGFALFACTVDEEYIYVPFLKNLDSPLFAGDIITSIGSINAIMLYNSYPDGQYIALTSDMLPYVLPININTIACFGNATVSALRYGTPNVPMVVKGDNKLQNGYLSFWYLQKYYEWDMPASRYKIGNEDVTQYAKGVIKLKTQDVSFPALEDVDLQKLIKTSIGEGQIEKLSINLSSRNGKATLKF